MTYRTLIQSGLSNGLATEPFLMEKEGCDKKRLLCFVKSTIEVKERTDLMSDKLSNVWIEIQGKHQKILICTAYREFSYIVTPRQMSGTIHVPIQGPLRTPKTP